MMRKNEAVIRADETVTFINVFEVDPARQAQLVDVLNEGADQVIRHRPGCISVSILASKDGTKVVNYAQWRSADDIKATREDPRAQEYAKKSAQLAQAAPSIYSVSSVFRPSASI